MIVTNYPPYHEAGDPTQGRAAIVELRLAGWSAKAIASYLGVHKATVHRTIKRWKESGLERVGDRFPFTNYRELRHGEVRRISILGTGVKIELVLAHFHPLVVARGAMENWCENGLGGSSFSWLRGGHARAMDHWLILNVGGGPTDDKPDVTLEPPGDPSPSG